MIHSIHSYVQYGVQYEPKRGKYGNMGLVFLNIISSLGKLFQTKIEKVTFFVFKNTTFYQTIRDFDFDCFSINHSYNFLTYHVQ